MMHRRRRLTASPLEVLAMVLAGLAIGTTAMAETIYVRSTSTELRDAASASGAALTSLERGDALEVVARDGSWVQVQARGQTGWIHRLKTSTTEPADGASVFAGLGGSRGDYVKEAEAGRGARGLDESAEEYARDERLSETAIAAVKRMEQVPVTDAEIERFLRDGQLGEWSP